MWDTDENNLPREISLIIKTERNFTKSYSAKKRTDDSIEPQIVFHSSYYTFEITIKLFYPATIELILRKKQIAVSRNTRSEMNRTFNQKLWSKTWRFLGKKECEDVAAASGWSHPRKQIAAAASGPLSAYMEI